MTRLPSTARLAVASFSNDDELVDVSAEVVDQVYLRSAEAMSELPGNSVALMVTSPPYHVGKDYDAEGSFEDYLGLLQRVFAEVHRVLEPGGRAAINVANLGRRPYLPLSHRVGAIMDELGFHMRGEIIWRKARGASGSCAFGTWLSARNPVLRDLHEYVLVYSKGRMGRVRTGTSTIGREEFLRDTLSVWEIPAESAQRVGHPAPFPVELPRRLIELYTFTGDVVLDPFMGSGQRRWRRWLPVGTTWVTTPTPATSSGRASASRSGGRPTLRGRRASAHLGGAPRRPWPRHHRHRHRPPSRSLEDKHVALGWRTSCPLGV
jgi:DNA modification methylase